MFNVLYEDSDGGRVVFEGWAAVPGKPEYHENHVAVFRYFLTDEQMKVQWTEDDVSPMYFLPRKEFEAKYTAVRWECGVDLYAILHGCLNRGTAREYSDKIELALIAAKSD